MTTRAMTNKAHIILFLLLLLFMACSTRARAYEAETDANDNNSNSVSDSDNFELSPSSTNEEDEQFLRHRDRRLSYYSNRNDNYLTNGTVAFSNCDYSVVAVTYISILCDSPYTFYYGNGANRNSPICDYKDKASINVQFYVVDNLQDGDTIFMTTAIYDDYDNILAVLEPDYLCNSNSYVAADCAVAGSYGFVTSVRLMAPYDGANRTKFYPSVKMAFSTEQDSGDNLGAVNTECQGWGNNNGNNNGHSSQTYFTWTDEHNEQKKQKTMYEHVIEEYGMLTGTGALLILCAMFIWRHAKHERPGEEDLLQQQQQYQSYNNGHDDRIIEYNGSIGTHDEQQVVFEGGPLTSTATTTATTITTTRISTSSVTNAVAAPVAQTPSSELC